MMTIVANKYPGTCHYCGRRVRKGAGGVWKSAARGGGYACAHTECIAEAVARGDGPDGGTSADTREAMGLPAAPDTRGPGRIVAEVRAILRVAAREAKRLADLASLDAALRRVLTTEEAAAVYAGEHANVPLGVLSTDAARERLKDALLPLPARVSLKTPHDDYGENVAGSFEVDEGEDAELSIDEAKRALAVRAEVDRVLGRNALVEDYSAEIRVHRFEADDDDDLGGVPAPRNVGLYVRMVLDGGAVLVKELAV